ncbi:MAG: Gfo/Idh/MocA family oxidoreductase [Verrucomicrobiaceae bacterium]|nr:Gfo/Idh/MocA family oxidoreductase [Verrucomicrobiaceae bacterium]
MAQTTSTTCRWGILGAAFIARKNWQSILDAGNATLIAVASRELAKAQAFIDECQAQVPHPVQPEALGSYEALLERPDIDAVYIPLPTGIRKEWVLRAVRAGKHVLVEKPVGCDAAEVEEILAACAERGVQFMDGVMFMHGQRLQQMRSAVDREVGPVRHIATQFSFFGDEAFTRANIRTHGTLEPLGCLGDLGWYCLSFTLWAMAEATPRRVTGRLHAEAGQGGGAPSVPLAFSGTLEFDQGVSASFYCSFHAAHAQWAIISGEKGLLQLADFVLPYAETAPAFSVTKSDFSVDGCRSDMRAGRESHSSDEPANNAPGSQESALFADFSTLVLTGQHEPRWGQISLLTQRVLDACLRSARADGASIAL